MPQLCAASHHRKNTGSTAPASAPANALVKALLLVAGVMTATPGVAELNTGSLASVTPQLKEGDILYDPAARLKTRSIAVSARSWPDGIVPYRLHADLSISGYNAVNKAVDYWNRVSGITLMSLDEWPAEQSLPEDHVLFQPGDGCASWVGRRGGEQEVWVAPNCNAGSMMHEIGHLLGLEHEHTRPDRDQHITIHWDNIDPDKHHNFDAAPAGTQMLGDYDYGSIMHYGPKNFSVNGDVTITPLVETSVTMGQRIAPSDGDLEAVAQLYATDLSIVTGFVAAGEADNDINELSVYISNSSHQGAHSIDVMASFGTGVLIDYSGDGWQCLAVANGGASCSLARLAGGGNSILSLELSGALSSADITAQVSSKSPDDDPYNNADGATGEPDQGAANALEDPAVSELTSSVTQLGAALWVWLALAAVLLQRLAGNRVNRQTGDRIERFRWWCIAVRRQA